MQRHVPTKMVSPAEKAKLILLVFFTLVIVIAIFSPLLDAFKDNKSKRLEPVRAMIQMHALKVDENILKEIRDDVDRARVRREDKPFQHLIALAGKLVPGTLTTMGLSEKPMDYDAVLKDPAAFRGKPVWIKGRLEKDPLILPYTPLKGLKDIRGKVIDENGRPYVFSMAQDSPKKFKAGDWVKVKGFFYKLWNPDARPGMKVPYIVGNMLYPAWSKWDPVTELDPALFPSMHEGSPVDPEETEPEAFYHFLSYAMNIPRKDVEGNKIPHLDAITMTRIKNDPSPNRGRLVRFSALVLRPPLIKAADENPLQLKWITRLWAGTDRPARLIQLILPGQHMELAKGMELKVVGCFMRNLEYVPEGQMIKKASAPIFLAVKATENKPVPQKGEEYIKLGFIVLSGAVILLLIVMISRDKKRHAEIQKEINLRRKKRLERKQENPLDVDSIL